MHVIHMTHGQQNSACLLPHLVQVLEAQCILHLRMICLCVAASRLLVLPRAHDVQGITRQVSCHVTLRASLCSSIVILSVGVKPKPRNHAIVEEFV